MSPESVLIVPMVWMIVFSRDRRGNKIVGVVLFKDQKHNPWVLILGMNVRQRRFLL